MSFTTHYQDWTITPRRSVSVGTTGAVGYYDYWLDGRRPHQPPPQPSSERHFGRVPFTDPHTDPVRNLMPTPTANVRYTRQVASYGQAAVAPRPESLPELVLPHQRFSLHFAAIGAGVGIRASGSSSTPNDPSYSGRLHYLDVGEVPGRTASELGGDGCVLDVSAGFAEVLSGQIVVLDWPFELGGGIAHLVRWLEHAIEYGEMLEEIAMRYLCRPTSAWGLVGGYGSGIAAGITLYLGIFVVTE